MLVLLLCACATPSQRRYYTIASGVTAVPAKTRFPVDLWVKEVEIAPVYNRPQIVYRYSPQELQYYNASNWADRPGRMVSQLLTKSLRASALFRSVTTRLGTSPPAYVLTCSVEALEELDAGDAWYAHLGMNLQLVKFSDQQVLWQYEFDERRPLNQRDLALVVRAMTDIYQDQLNTIILPQLEATLNGAPMPPLPVAASVAGPLAAPFATAAPPPIEDRLKPDRATGPGTSTLPPKGGGTPSSNPGDFQKVDWRRNRQYTSDPTQVPAGKGAIFIPALSEEPDREPDVEVYRGEQSIAAGNMGRRIVVPPGSYRVYFGSGTLSQRMSRDVVVRADETSIVQADWGALDVSVMDDKFIPFRGSYELIRMDDREFIGTGYGADEERGEQTQVWVLSPGRYKIIQPGSTYRARTNFATVQLQPGTLVPFTLVLDTATRDFLGAGVSDVEVGKDKDKVWSLRVSVGGTALVSQRSDELSNAGTSLSFQVFSDNLLRFSQGRHLWSTRLDIEEGQTLQSTTREDGTPGSFLKGEYHQVPLTDLAYLNSIYVYRLFSWVGPYLRVGGNTQLLPNTRVLETPTDVVILDAAGNPAGSLLQTSEVRLSGPFSPIELRQGAGANFKVFHNTHLDMDLRAGLGMREFLANGLLRVEDDPATPGLELRMGLNSILAGPELAVLATARITRYVQLTTDFDSLVPFQGFDQTQFKWRNTVNLRLASYASLAYTLNLDRNPDIGLKNPLTFDHGIQLRFAFTLF